MANSDDYTEKEVDARREAGLKRLLATPPTPHKPKPNAKAKRPRKKGR